MLKGTSHTQSSEDDAELNKKIAELQQKLKDLEYENQEHKKMLAKTTVQHTVLEKKVNYFGIAAKLAESTAMPSTTSDDTPPKSETYLRMRARIDAKKSKKDPNISSTNKKNSTSKSKK